MKIKFSWIPFIPVAVLSVVLRVYQLLFIEKGVDPGFLSSEMAWIVYTALVALLFFVLLILCGADRKTSPTYQPKTNVFAGLFGVITAGVVIYNAGMSLGALLASVQQSTGTNAISMLVDSIFGFLGGIAIIIMAISSFSGKNLAQKMGVFSIAAPVWCCVEMITKFIEYTKQGVHSCDMTNLFALAFLTLAVFNLSMVYQGINCKNPIKGTFLYGLPGFVVSVVYVVADAVSQILDTGTYDIMGSLDSISLVLISLYILFMLVEFTTNVQEKSEKNKAEVALEEENKLMVDESENDEEAAENKHTEITDVEENINKDLDEVDSVIDAMEKDEKNPEKINPLSKAYFDSQEKNSVSDNEDEISKSLADIDKLIDEINAGE